MLIRYKQHTRNKVGKNISSVVVFEPSYFLIEKKNVLNDTRPTYYYNFDVL